MWFGLLELDLGANEHHALRAFGACPSRHPLLIALQCVLERLSRSLWVIEKRVDRSSGDEHDVTWAQPDWRLFRKPKPTETSLHDVNGSPYFGPHLEFPRNHELRATQKRVPQRRDT